MYDVIVIGAGPCGCTAAITLSKNGLKVLLLEKSKLPRYKSCSGVLIEKSMNFIKNQLGQTIPDYVTCSPAKNCGMIFTDDFGKEYRFESRGLNIWRDKFDFWLTSLAKENGVIVQDESAVIDIQETDNAVSVFLKDRIEYSKFVIDCSSAVGIGKQKHKNIITYQTFNKGIIDLDPHYFYAYLQPELSGFDAWFNVKDDMLVLGVATTNANDISTYYNNFISYMTNQYGLKIDKQLSTDKWLIRNIQPNFDIDYGKGRILNAGENAGFLNPMGEGISSALDSGYYSALAIIENFNNPQNVIESYKNNTEQTRNYMKRQWQLLGRMSKKFSYFND